MKRILAFLMVLMVIGAQAWAASSVTDSTAYVDLLGRSDYLLTWLTLTCDTDGSFDAYTITSTDIEGFIVQVEVDPDTSAAGAYPTDQFDITITNERGADVLGGAGSDVDSSMTKIIIPTPDGTNVSPVFNDGDLAVDALNNSVNGAVIRVYIWWKRAN